MEFVVVLFVWMADTENTAVATPYNVFKNDSECWDAVRIIESEFGKGVADCRIAHLKTPIMEIMPILPSETDVGIRPKRNPFHERNDR